VTFRFKVKTEQVSRARLDVRLRYSGLDDIVFKGRNIEGSTNWTEQEISWDASKLQRADAIALDLLMRSNDSTMTPTIWLKDVELVKTPMGDTGGKP
jgi:hypothetical protein